MKQLGRLLPALILLFQKATAESLGEVLSKHDSTSKLYHLLRQLGLLEQFNAVQNATFLAMTDTAIDNLAEAGRNLSAICPMTSGGILKYHLLEGALSAADLAQSAEMAMPHSVLRPPILTNVTDGPVVKLWSCNTDDAIYIESGIRKRSKIEERDIYYDSGVIHTIGSALTLPNTLVETTNTDPDKGFRVLMERSGMTEVIESLRDVTILVPSYEAVENAFPGDTLMSLKSEDLARIVMNHVIPNRVLYHDSIVREEWRGYKTLSGTPIWLGRAKDGWAFVNGRTQILQEDVLIWGGVAHVIDEVLLAPPSRIVRVWILFTKMGHVCTSKATQLVQSAKGFIGSVTWWSVFKIFTYTATAVAVMVVAIVRLLGWMASDRRVSYRSLGGLAPPEDSTETLLVKMGLLTDSDLHDYDRVSGVDEEMGDKEGR